MKPFLMTFYYIHRSVPNQKSSESSFLAPDGSGCRNSQPNIRQETPNWRSLEGPSPWSSGNIRKGEKKEKKNWKRNIDQEHQENMAHKINYVGLIVVTDTEATVTEPACMCARSLHISYGCSAWDFCSIPNRGNGGVSDSFTLSWDCSPHTGGLVQLWYDGLYLVLYFILVSCVQIMLGSQLMFEGKWNRNEFGWKSS